MRDVYFHDSAWGLKSDSNHDPSGPSRPNKTVGEVDSTAHSARDQPFTQFFWPTRYLTPEFGVNHRFLPSAQPKVYDCRFFVFVCFCFSVLEAPARLSEKAPPSDSF